VIGWHTATHPNERKKVIHLTSGTQNPVTWGEFLDYSREAVMKAPSIKIVRPLAKNPTSARGPLGRMNHLFTKFVSHILFAYIVDLILVLMGYKKLMVKVTLKMHRAFTVLEHFTNKEWCFHNDNYLEIHDLLSPQDQKTFSSDIRTIDWRQYAKDVYMGTRRYLLKEDDNNIEKAKRRLLFIRCFYTLFQIIILALFWYFIVYPVFSYCIK
jgi:fatty acyl-CoA reductase